MTDSVVLVTPQLMATIAGAAIALISSVGIFVAKELLDRRRKISLAKNLLVSVSRILRRSVNTKSEVFPFLNTDKILPDLIFAYSDKNFRDAHLEYLEAYSIYNSAWSKGHAPTSADIENIGIKLDFVHSTL